MDAIVLFLVMVKIIFAGSSKLLLTFDLLLTQKYIGCVEGPIDLSTNKNYMNGYGS